MTISDGETEVCSSQSHRNTVVDSTGPATSFSKVNSNNKTHLYFSETLILQLFKMMGPHRGGDRFSVKMLGNCHKPFLNIP